MKRNKLSRRLKTRDLMVPIKPCDVFYRDVLHALGFTEDFLDEEVRLGNLRAYSRGGRELFIGSDVLSWIRTGKPVDVTPF